MWCGSLKRIKNDSILEITVNTVPPPLINPRISCLFSLGLKEQVFLKQTAFWSLEAGLDALVHMLQF